MPNLGPRSKFGAPFGLRGSDSRGCVRRPKKNRSGSRGIGIGIRIRELMIQVCEFGMQKPKDFEWLKSDSQIDQFQFFKV
jgi:hypothetical protein